MKKLLSLLACLALAFSLVNMPVHAENTVTEVNSLTEAVENNKITVSKGEETSNYESLPEAIAACEENDVITISGRVEMPGVEGTSKVTDMRNILIKGADSSAELVFVNYPGSKSTGTGTFTNLNLQNLSVVDETFYTGENGENAWEFTYLELGGTNTFENVNFTDGIFVDSGESEFNNCSFVGHNNDSSEYGNITMYGAWVHNGSASFENCEFTGTRGLKIHEDYGSEVKEVIVKNCTFIELSEKPGIVLGTLNADTTVSVLNCTFDGCAEGDQGSTEIESDTKLNSINFYNPSANGGILVPGEKESSICFEFVNISTSKSSTFKAELYAGETYLTYKEITLQPADTTLTCSFYTVGESSSWKQDEWTAYEAVMPTHAVFYIDGVEIASDEVDFTKEQWIAFAGVECDEELDVVDKVEATCTENGYTGDKVCGTCGETKEEGTVVEATGHLNTNTENVKPATCTEDGYTGDVFCNDCETVVTEGQVIKATGHVNTEKVNAKDATCTEKGYTGDVVCKDCEAVVTKGEDIAVVEHKYTEGKCSVCGEEDPSAKQPSGEGDAEQQPTTPTTPDKKPTVNTGDNTDIALYATLAVIALGAVVVLRKKEQA